MIIVAHLRYTDHVSDDGKVLTRIWHRDGRVQVMHWQTWSVDSDGIETGVYVPEVKA